jgi:hypothetical protein
MATRKLRIAVLLIYLSFFFLGTESQFPGQLLEGRLNSFDVGKHKKQEERRSKIKKQEAHLHAKQAKSIQLNIQYSINGTRFCDNSLPYPHEYLSNTTFHDEIILMTTKERRGAEKCSFLGSVCQTESIEHSLVAKYFRSSDTVLEVMFSASNELFASTQYHLLTVHALGWCKIWYNFLRYC